MTKLKVIKSDDVKETFQDRVSDVLEEMWDKIGQHHHGLYATPGKMRGPHTDLSEKKGNLTYRLEVPGLGEDEIEIETTPNLLIVRGEKREEQEQEGENFVFRERRYGKFERRFPLPKGAKPSKTSAELENGILTVKVPCKAAKASETTKVPIN